MAQGLWSGDPGSGPALPPPCDLGEAVSSRHLVCKMRCLGGMWPKNPTSTNSL